MIDPEYFIAIGEKVHCSRVYKSGGIKTLALPEGGEVVSFVYEDENLALALPKNWAEISPAYADGKIKHVAVAIHTAINSENDEAVDLALKYLFALTQQQLDAGAAFIDLNVDEYAPDTSRRVAAMRWLASTLALQFEQACFAIDSSDPAVLHAGLESASINGQRHMLNSVSLERLDAVQSAVEFRSAVMAGAAGRTTLPSTVEEKIANLGELLKILDDVCVAMDEVFIDPLVLPLSTDGKHGREFLESVTKIASEFEGIHISGGLSNVSFGMPRRKLLNSVFLRMAIEAGCDSGIIDPVETSPAEAMAMDTESEQYILARNFLLGQDEYGMEFISAHRDGRLD